MDEVQQRKQQVAPGSSEEVAQARYSRPRGDGRSQLVRATRTGYYDFVRRREGDEFKINPSEYGTTWMVAINESGGDEDVEQSEKLTRAINGTRLENAAQRLQDRNLAAGLPLSNDAQASIQARIDAGKRLRGEAGITERSDAPLGDRVTNQGELKRGSNAHPDTGRAPSSGEGTNLNPGPRPDKHSLNKAATPVSNKNVL